MDILKDGIRPFPKDSSACEDCKECINICPGHLMNKHNDCPSIESSFGQKKWGAICELWEGYAGESAVRFLGSSGGIATSLALFCLERLGFQGVLHVGSKKKEPWKNETKFSQTQKEILSCTGSRYSPASPCNGLSQIEQAGSPCMFIGKPCDVAGIQNVIRLKPAFSNKIGLLVSIFCAGTPSSQGTLDLLTRYNINPEQLGQVCYRGKGWPGRMSASLRGENKPSLELSYEEAWGFLQKYRPFRCYLCPDGTGEQADISCGDAWYRKGEKGNQGLSLVVARTERGKRILHAAMEAGYVHLERIPIEALEKSQINLLNKKRAIWGRLLAMKMFGIPTPKYQGYHLFENWVDLPFKEKAKSILGTVRRIVQRKYYRPVNYTRE